MFNSSGEEKSANWRVEIILIRYDVGKIGVLANRSVID
jgi:hypothetical protein